jgi:hypothetical protein
MLLSARPLASLSLLLSTITIKIQTYFQISRL